MSVQRRVHLITDGACSGNPGPGGWAFILRDAGTGTEREQTGGETETTNNRMELTAVIMGLRGLEEGTTVELYSDSQYVLKGLKEWMADWKRRGWRTAAKKPVKNRELWEELDGLASRHEIRFHWVRGHNDHPDNDRADRLAVEARDRAASGR